MLNITQLGQLKSQLIKLAISKIKDLFFSRRSVDILKFYSR